MRSDCFRDGWDHRFHHWVYVANFLSFNGLSLAELHRIIPDLVLQRRWISYSQFGRPPSLTTDDFSNAFDAWLIEKLVIWLRKIGLSCATKTKGKRSSSYRSREELRVVSGVECLAINPVLWLEGEDGGGDGEDDDEKVAAVDDDDMDSCLALILGSGLWSWSSDFSWSFSGPFTGSGFAERIHIGAARAEIYLEKRGFLE